MKDKKREHYYLKAKSEHYRSRAAYKLLQLQEKFHILSEGMSCLDLGSAPGGWLQVESQEVGPGGRVFGIDISAIRPLEGVVLLRGDVTSPGTVAEMLEKTGGRVDVIFSDMSPDISGNYSLDHARSVELVRTSAAVASYLLRKGGTLVAKLFDGDMTKELVADLQRVFTAVRLSKPPASRKQSSEIYIVARGFSGN
jgi:23S rRNA (uridine2552-2'-O)-methyltransferase